MELSFLRWPGRRACRRLFSSRAPSACIEPSAEAGDVNLSYPSYIVWGANTGLGKTLVSTGLCGAALGDQQPRNVLYVKPVQTGFPEDSDARFLSQKINAIHGDRRDLFISNHAVRVSEAARRKAHSGSGESCSLPQGAISVEQGLHPHLWKSSVECQEKASSFSSTLTCKTLWSWSAPVSPHIAARDEGETVEDGTLVEALRGSLWGLNRSSVQGGGILKAGKSLAFVETAGGVASPGPSGTLQCDLYRPLRLPGILVGDGKLGGISTTLAAYESLLLRGYDTQCVMIQDLGLSNDQHLSRHLGNEIPVFALPRVPDDLSDNLDDWFKNSKARFSEILSFLEDVYLKRIDRFSKLPNLASDLLWWPFTQHTLVPRESVTLIDSRCGERFSVYNASKSDLTQTFDGCASWWTQGPDAAMQHELSKQVAYAAARYGHVMFPENVHEPALRCAELLLQGVGQGWANRVYFSDNGSTAIEISIKMALRKYAADHNLLDPSNNDKALRFKVLALKGSYHGDTLGAMEAQAASPFTGFLQQPWYTGRGLFLEPPTVDFRHSQWRLHMPDEYRNLVGNDASFSTWNSREEVFSSARNHSVLAKTYTSLIAEEVSRLEAEEPTTKVAGLIIEPIIHAAGGMKLVDPLFQRMLVGECKARSIPVIFDEVFTGLWRLGAESAAEILDSKPDIACYAKLLTGGIVPLAATLASEDVFQAFQGPSKFDALLHGHSYTAHPIGCTAAVTALQWFKDPSKNTNFVKEKYRLKELWDPSQVTEISNHPLVERVLSLGTLFAIQLKSSQTDKGYGSMSSKALVDRLRADGLYVRPLGDVVYLMCGPTTPPSTCSTLLCKLHAHLDKA